MNDNRWNLIFDFTENKDGSLNFSEIDPSQWSFKAMPVPDMELCNDIVFPYMQKYGGVLDDNINEGKQEHNAGLLGFKMGTSPEEALKAL